jgi:hypothetical protein
MTTSNPDPEYGAPLANSGGASDPTTSSRRSPDRRPQDGGPA